VGGAGGPRGYPACQPLRPGSRVGRRKSPPHLTVEKTHLNARSHSVNDHHFSRRHFFYGTLLARAVPSGGFGSTPSLSALGYKSLNEKLNIAAIGLGTRGPAILQGAAPTENIVALCDVDEVRSARGFQTYPKASKHKDYRTMLDKEGKNIDAVMIATPDHMHTPIALLCM